MDRLKRQFIFFYFLQRKTVEVLSVVSVLPAIDGSKNCLEFQAALMKDSCKELLRVESV